MAFGRHTGIWITTLTVLSGISFQERTEAKPTLMWKINSKLLKNVLFQRLVRMWSGGEEHVRVLAFLGIRNVSTIMPASLLEFTVKVCLLLIRSLVLKSFDFNHRH